MSSVWCLCLHSSVLIFLKYMYQHLFGLFCLHLFCNLFHCCADWQQRLRLRSRSSQHLIVLWHDTDGQLEAVSIMLISFFSTARTEGDFLKTVLSKSLVLWDTQNSLIPLASPVPLNSFVFCYGNANDNIIVKVFIEVGVLWMITAPVSVPRSQLREIVLLKSSWFGSVFLKKELYNVYTTGVT